MWAHMETDQKYTIGFSNIYEQNPFTRKLRECMEDLAETMPHIDLVVRDNDRDTPRAIANSEYFASIPVDAAIIFHIDERAGQKVIYPLRIKGIPMLTVDIPIPTVPYFGLNNKRVGEEAGEVLADWINENWDGKVDKTLVVVFFQLLEFFQQRVKRALDVMEERVPEFSKDNVLFVDNGSTPDVTAERVAQVLDTWKDHHHIAIACMNDDVAVGTLDAIAKAGREDEVALLSHDGTHVAIEQFKRESSPMKVSTLLKPETYAEHLLDLSVRLAKGERIPPWNYAETTPMTRENFRELLPSVDAT